MAIAMLPDGRWVCYWRDRATKKIIKKYCGRGFQGEHAAIEFHNSLNLLDVGRVSKRANAHRAREKLPPAKKTKLRNTQDFYVLYEKMRAQDTCRNVEFEAHTKMGFIDALYSDEIVEIKPVSVWHHGYGQLMAYGACMPKKKLRLFLFGDCSISKLRRVKMHCMAAGISLTFCGDVLGPGGFVSKINPENRIFTNQPVTSPGDFFSDKATE